MNEDTPFSNREIREMVKDTSLAIARVEEQTKEHNHRMTKMEEWKAYSLGAMSVITLIILPILGWALWALVNIQDTVDASVKDAFKEVQLES